MKFLISIVVDNNYGILIIALNDYISNSVWKMEKWD